jgi:hypothetical protein
MSLPELHVVTYHTSDEKSKYTFETGKFHGMQVQNLSTTMVWNGYQDKLIAMHKFVHTVSPDDIVCFVDAYDSILNASKEELIEKFLNEDAEIVFGAEINCHPPCMREFTWPESPTPLKHLNSGFYIGYARALRKLFSSAPLQGDDQEYIARYFLENRTEERLKLDVYARLVINMDKMPWDFLQIQHGYIYLTAEGLDQRPCCFHFCGMSYLDVNKDYVRKSETELQFVYHAVYDRTFIALLSCKMVTRQSDVVCRLTGRGASY